MNNSRWKSLGVSDNEELLIELLMHLEKKVAILKMRYYYTREVLLLISQRDLYSLLWIVSEF